MAGCGGVEAGDNLAVLDQVAGYFADAIACIEREQVFGIRSSITRNRQAGTVVITKAAVSRIEFRIADAYVGIQYHRRTALGEGRVTVEGCDQIKALVVLTLASVTGNEAFAGSIDGGVADN